MLSLIVRNNGQILIGEMVIEIQDDLDYITMKKVVIVNLVQSQDGNLVPVPHDYPHPYLDTLLTKKRFESLTEFEFKKVDILYFDENDMNIDIIDWYKRVQANKSGIQITSEMPNKSESGIIH